MNTQAILALIPGFIVGLTIHEFSHAYVATRLGDPTARFLGRLTLNPLAHLDVLGSIMLIFAGFGWAKPVPVNEHYLHSPRRDMALIAIAGPISNILLAMLIGFALRVTFPAGFSSTQVSSWMGIAAWVSVQAVWINVVLAAFNLLPIPPLDGSRVLAGIVPPSWNHGYQQMERFGPMLLLALVVIASLSGVSLFGRLIAPVAKPLLALVLGGWLDA